MIFPGFPGVLSIFQVFQVEWEPWYTVSPLPHQGPASDFTQVCPFEGNDVLFEKQSPGFPSPHHFRSKDDQILIQDCP